MEIQISVQAKFRGPLLLLKLAIALAVLSALSVPAAAQIPNPSIFFGYTYTSRDIYAPKGPYQVTEPQSVSLNGWEGSLAEKIFPFTSIVADFAGHYDSISLDDECTPGFSCVPLQGRVYASIQTYLFGPQVSVSLGKFGPFAHFLFGAAHLSDDVPAAVNFSNSDTSFSYGLGGGLDYRLSHLISWRVQADALRTRFFGATQNDLRISTGVVLHF